jgi:hypothetical protein
LIVAPSWIGQTIAVCKGDGPLTEAFQHQYVKFAALREINSRVEPVGGKACASANSKDATSFGHKGPCRQLASGCKW